MDKCTECGLNKAAHGSTLAGITFIKHQFRTRATDLIKAREALEVIKQFSFDYCLNPKNRNTASDDVKISAGLSVLINHDPTISLDIAARLAEDVNFHELAAIIRK